MRALGPLTLSAVIQLSVSCGGDAAGNAEEADSHGATGGRAGSASGAEAGSNDGGDSETSDGSGGATTGGKAGDGGKTAAGAPSHGGDGGSSVASGGDAGTGGVPARGGGSSIGGGGTVAPPEGCRVDVETFDTALCQVRLSCNDGLVDTVCRELNGLWVCTCSADNIAFRIYEVADLKVIADCQAVANLCQSDDEPKGSVECKAQSESRSASSCQVSQDCRQRLEAGSGATLTTFEQVVCESDGTRMLCSCWDAGGEFELEGRDGSTACDRMLDVCREFVEPDFEDAETCRPELQSGGSGYCEIQEVCSRSAAIGEGVRVSQSRYRQVLCGTGANGVPSCSCNGTDGGFRLEIQEPVAGIDSCTAISGACWDGEIELYGEPICSVANQAAQSDSCQAQLECGVSATASGRELTVFGYVDVYCDRSGDAWICTCSSKSHAAKVSAQGASAWEACTQASAVCADLVPVDFGSGT